MTTYGLRGRDLDPVLSGAGAPIAALAAPKALKVLRERARQLAERPASPAVAARQDLLVVRCGSARYGIELAHLVGVHPASSITPLPDAPCHCLGVAVIGGHLYPVFDLAGSLGRPPVVPAFLALVKIAEDRVVGFAVAEVEGTETVRGLADAPVNANAAVRGVTRDLVAVLDTAVLVSFPDTTGPGGPARPRGERQRT